MISYHPFTTDVILFFTAAINITIESVRDSSIDARITLVTPHPVGYFEVSITGGGHSETCRLAGNITNPICVFKGLPSVTKFTLSGQPCTEVLIDICGYTTTTEAWTLPIRKCNGIKPPTLCACLL